MRRFTFRPWRTGFRGLLAACVRGSRLPPHHFLVIVVTVCCLAGCAAPRGFLKPVAARAPGTSQVEMVVATTRSRASTPGEMFSGARGVTASFADMIVSIPPEPLHQRGDVEWPRQIPGNPATEFVTLRADDISKPEAIATFDRLIEKSSKRRALVFVHGFNNRFEDAVFRFAQLVHDSRTDAAPVLFTWPSKGSVLAYGYDRESASYSRDALEELLRWLVKNPDVGSVSVLAHSMGNWVTLEALRQMAIRDGKIPRKIDTVLLAAPDVDVDLARAQVAAMGPQRPIFVLFVSQDDRALAASRRLWGNVRLGAIDPDQEPLKSELRRDRIEVVNLTGVPSPDKLGHGTYAENPEVVGLIGRMVASGQTLGDSRVGLGETITLAATGAAASVGHAAGIVVTAPLAIVDPVTREHYGDHVEALTQSLQDAATLQ